MAIFSVEVPAQVVVNYTQSLGTGNGTVTTFAGTLTNGPVVPGQVTVTAGAVTLKDDGLGKITGTGGSGTIEYNTKAISVTFTAAPANAVGVSVAYKDFKNDIARQDFHITNSMNPSLMMFNAASDDVGLLIYGKSQGDVWTLVKSASAPAYSSFVLGSVGYSMLKVHASGRGRLRGLSMSQV